MIFFVIWRFWIFRLINIDFGGLFFVMNGSNIHVESASHVPGALGKCFRRGSNGFMSGISSEVFTEHSKLQMTQSIAFTVEGSEVR